MKRLVIIGAGSHSKVIIDILLENKEYEIVGLTDIGKDNVLGFPVIGTDDVLLNLKKQGIDYAFIAVGNNPVREKLFYKVKQLGFKIINAVSNGAIISKYAEIGEGVAIMPGAIVNACCKIGDGVIINTNATVDHDGIVGNFVHIAPGSAVSGSVSIGEMSFLGTGCRVIDNISIGKNVMVGAGGVVVNNLEDNCRALGVPAKKYK